ncbi:MAG: hypothetical protein ACWA5U_00460 [bacterium]
MPISPLSRRFGFRGIVWMALVVCVLVIMMMVWQSATSSHITATATPSVSPRSVMPLVVQPEAFKAISTTSANPALHSQRAKLTIEPQRQTLEPLSIHEQQHIESSNQAASDRLQPQTRQVARATQIGLGRELSQALATTLTAQTLQWVDVPHGKVAHWLIESPQAQAIRLLIQAKQFPQQAELRFFSPDDVHQHYGVYQADDLFTDSQNFWSPTVRGQVLGLEIFLPSTTHAPTANLELVLPKISHVYADIFSSTPAPSATHTASDGLQKTTKASTRGTAASCHRDVMCAESQWHTVSKAVAKYIYVKANGSAYYCSGTLLADNDSSTQIPYFATANHCISDSTTAATMDFYWLYQNNSCGDTLTKSTALRTHQGGTLLANLPETDMSLVLLTQNPPNGTHLAGWRLTAPQPQSQVVGIHHPNGDVKKYSAGTFEQFETITIANGWYMIEQNPDGNFMQVRWTTGITAGGSSGSGLWEMDQQTPYFIGVLSGGSSYCSAPHAPDDYGRFDRSYAAFSQWLNPSAPQVNLNVTASGTRTSALKDGILLARYLQGLRGEALLKGIAEHENSTTVSEKLAQSLHLLDVDADGQVNAEYDALLVVRYLLGLRGEALIQQAVSASAQRQSSDAIETFLQQTLVN